MEKVCCVICKKEYSKKGIFTHYDRSHLGKTNYSSGYNGKYDVLSERAKENRTILEEEYLKKPNKCKRCKIDLDFSARNNLYCSHSCSASITNVGKVKTVETKIKISKSLMRQSSHKECNCNFCGKLFETKRRKKYCSNECKRQEYLESLTERNRYRRECQFQFLLQDYPDKFDFSLIEKYGWYKATNRGNNPNGISRDHMISIYYGWKNKIDPKIISHPANCALIPQNENHIKRTKCSITVDELHNRIKNW
jgi:hypothetical protein